MSSFFNCLEDHHIRYSKFRISNHLASLQINHSVDKVVNHGRYLPLESFFAFVVVLECEANRSLVFEPLACSWV